MTTDHREALSADELTGYLEECRVMVLEEIDRLIPRAGALGPALYDLMRRYPFRRAKALRPALCVAACRVLGGRLEDVLPTAAVLELYHNAFLIHDDVEDASLLRRDEPTLHREVGVPIAVNVGDGMLALTLTPLLDNMRHVGMGKALRVLDVIARMARESAEGQAIELDWRRRQVWRLGERDYLRMVHKKTSWYSFLAPLTIGAILAGADARMQWNFRRLGTLLGSAFQIQDDVLNLRADPQAYGKDAAGDLLEGKRTLVLLHAIRSASAARSAELIALVERLSETTGRDPPGRLRAELDQLVAARELSAAGRDRVYAALDLVADAAGRRGADLERALALIEGCGSVAHAQAVAARHTRRAEDSMAAIAPALRPSVHRAFLEGVIAYVSTREQ